jgi:hypothetical protein
LAGLDPANRDCVPAELQTLAGKEGTSPIHRHQGRPHLPAAPPAIVLEFAAMLQMARVRLEGRPTFKLMRIIRPFQNILRMIPDLPLKEAATYCVPPLMPVKPPCEADRCRPNEHSGSIVPLSRENRLRSRQLRFAHHHGARSASTTSGRYS